MLGAPSYSMTDPSSNTNTNPSNPNPPSLSQLLREAQELVMQCRAAPSLATGMYDETLLAVGVQRGVEQMREESVRLAAEVCVIGGPSSSRGYIGVLIIS